MAATDRRRGCVVQNRHSGRRLYAQERQDGNVGFGATTGRAGQADQVWWLEDAGEGAYRLVNACSGRALYAQVGKQGHRGVGAHGQYKECMDQLWELLPRSAGGYRVVNVASKRGLYAQSGSEGLNGVGAHTEYADHPDQGWDFLPQAPAVEASLHPGVVPPDLDRAATAPPAMSRQRSASDEPAAGAEPVFVEGQQVEVWSNSRGAWLDGVVQAVFATAGVAEGYSVRPGTVRVASAAGVKWVMPEQVGTLLRSKEAPPSASLATSETDSCGRRQAHGSSRGPRSCSSLDMSSPKSSSQRQAGEPSTEAVGEGTGKEPLPPLPFVGVLEKQSELLGVWQPRRVELRPGRLSYFKDGLAEARRTFGREDVAGVRCQPPCTVLLAARLPGGEDRTYALRAASEEEMRLWVRLVRAAFELPETRPAPPQAPEGPPTAPATPSNAPEWAAALFSGASRAAEKTAAAVLQGTGFAVGQVLKASGTEDWVDRKLGDARRTTAQLSVRIEQQLEEALTSCDEGKTEMLLDTALASGIVGENMPAVVRRAARRAAGRNLRDATATGDARRLKGALLAARRLQATDVPEFEPAVAKYKEVRQLPEGWNVGNMLDQRRRGTAKLLVKPDVSGDVALRSLVQLLFDRTFRQVETRDRLGEALPVRFQVVRVAEVQHEAHWAAYLERREAVRQELQSRGFPERFFRVAAATEQALAEAAALHELPAMRVRVPAVHRPGDLMEVDSPATGEPLMLSVPDATQPDSEVPLQSLLAGSLPGPPVDASINETWLFHGTRPIAAESITSDVFRIDLAGSSAGTMLGRGIYLAENSTKADEYSRPDPKTGLFTMLLCRATLGRALYSADVVPNPRACEEACLKGDYHSVLGDRRAVRGTFREFAVFDEEQVYASYIVHYRRTPAPRH